MRRLVAVSVVIMLSMFAVSIARPGKPQPRVQFVKDAVVVDANGTDMGIALDYHFPASDVTVHIGLIIGGKGYTPGVRPLSFTTPGAVAVLYESTNCAGQPYVRAGASGVDDVQPHSMVGTIPIIAPNDPITKPTNETLWEVDHAVQPLQKEIRSRWNNTAQEEGTSLPIAPRCEANGSDSVEVLPITEVFNLSSLFTPPYSLRLRKLRRH